MLKKRLSNLLIGGPPLNQRTIPAPTTEVVQKVPVQPGSYAVGDFVYCWVIGDFGTIVSRTDDLYTVKLKENEEVPNIHINNLWKAGRA